MVGDNMGYFKNKKNRIISEKLAQAKEKIAEAKQKNAEAQWREYSDSEVYRYVEIKSTHHVRCANVDWLGLGDIIPLDSDDSSIIEQINKCEPGKVYFPVYENATYRCALTGKYCPCVHSDTVKCNICNVSFDKRNDNHV